MKKKAEKIRAARCHHKLALKCNNLNEKHPEKHKCTFSATKGAGKKRGLEEGESGASYVPEIKNVGSRSFTFQVRIMDYGALQAVKEEPISSDFLA